MSDTKIITCSAPFRIRKSIYPFKGKAANSWSVTWKNTIIVGDWEDPSIVLYHQNGEWTRQELIGDIPKRRLYIAKVLEGKIILIECGYGATMYSLAPETWMWTRLSPGGSPKTTQFTLAQWIHDGKLYWFGGMDSHDQVSNRLWCYDPSVNTWEVKAQSGDIPSPRYSCCATIDDEGTVFLFGGKGNYGTEDSGLNDLFMLNMRSFHWKKIHGSSTGSSGGRVMPLKRCYPLSFTSISPSAAIFNSVDEFDLPFESWLLDLDLAKQHMEAPSRIWTQIPNDFYAGPVDCLPVREPQSGSLWLIGYYSRPRTITPEILKISPFKLSLKELTLDYIIRNMSTDRLLTDHQIPMELKNDIMLHKLKV